MAAHGLRLTPRSASASLPPRRKSSARPTRREKEWRSSSSSLGSGACWDLDPTAPSGVAWLPTCPDECCSFSILFVKDALPENAKIRRLLREVVNLLTLAPAL